MNVIHDTHDVWLTIRDAAGLLRVGRRTLDRQIRAGRLKAARVNGRDLRIHRSWLEEWASKQVDPTE